jgi:hypothetical protein
VVGRGRWRRLALGSCGWRARRLEEDGGDRVVNDDNDGNTLMAARDNQRRLPCDPCDPCD